MARILLLEDDPLQAKLATLYLQYYGHEVVCADTYDPVSATEPIKLVIVHVDRALRSEQVRSTVLPSLRQTCGSGLRMLAICEMSTDDHDDRCMREARQLGADRVLTRPYPLDSLRNEVAALVR